MLQFVAYTLSPSFRATANDDVLAREVLYSGVRAVARTEWAQAVVTRAARPRPRNAGAVSRPASAAAVDRRAQKHTLTASPSMSTAIM